MRLEWSKLLSAKTEVERSVRKDTDHRNPYESDYDRIVFSSPFRRMQDKAQVFPLEKSDFVRTRLTHSMEVAALARSIGISIEKELMKGKKLPENYEKGSIPTILESAGMAHDLGNPPFGHYGEEVIKRAFNSKMKKEENTEVSKKEDLLNFDGNCQTIRILTRLQCLKDEWGMHITYATLATLMKYPMDSVHGNKKDGIVYHKKFGYFQSEKEIAENVLKETGLWQEEGCAYRHPLALVLEAADDIAYSAADLEDGYKKHVIQFKDIVDVFERKRNSMSEGENSYFNGIVDKIKEKRKLDACYSEEKLIQDIRIYLQGEMIDAVNKAFIDNYEDIMNGKFNEELLQRSKAKEIREALKILANDYILCDDEVQKTELAGESIIEYLVNYFVEAFDDENFKSYIKDKFEEKEGKKNLNPRISRVYNLISDDYKMIFEKKVKTLIQQEEVDIEKEITYYSCLMITDYISGMTDNYCVDLYRRLKGIDIR